MSASCIEAENHSDLGWLEQEVFSKSCSLSAVCHAGQAQLAQGLNLEAGMVEANTVGVPARGDYADGMNIVESGDANQSYLMVALGDFGENDPRLPPEGTMPLQNDVLCQQKRDAIRRWIDSL